MTVLRSAGVKQNGMLIDDEGRAQIFGAIEGEDRHINQSTGKAWSIPFEVTTTGADAIISYIKNIGSSNLHVTDTRMNNTGTASAVDFIHVNGTPGDTADVVAISRNLGNPVPLIANIFEANIGTGITGLTNLGLIFPKFAKANDEMHLRTSSNIIVPPGQAMAILVATSGAIAKGVISIVEVPVELGAR